MVDQQVLHKIRVSIKIKGVDEESSRVIEKSLKPEVESQVDAKRGSVKLLKENNFFVIEIESGSSSGARALFNAYIYLLKTIFDVLE